MYCRFCGTLNDDNAFKCVNCGKVIQSIGGGTGGFPQRIPNYLVQSILVTLFCCLPLGIPAIIFSAEVNSKVQAGDIQGAMESSRKAKMWGWISFGAGIILPLIYFFFIIIIADM